MLGQGSVQLYYTSIKAGAELIQTLSESLYKNVYYVFDELISNAYDADASEVKIKMTKNEIVLSDNGEGMDKEGLEHYLWLGYSEKQRDRTTKKFNRYTIGKFGIGKLTMHVICDVCKVETVKDGVKRVLTLDFKRILSYKGLSDGKIEVSETPAKRSEVGTTIRLIGLKKRIEEAKVIRRIVRNMPLSPNFQVKLNDSILKPEDIIKGRGYEIHLSLPLTGEVHGRLIHADAPLGDFAGIYVKVHGRTVNVDEPNMFDLYNSIQRPGPFLARLYGVLSADGLDDVILANRNGFNEDSPKYVEFRQAILEEIRRITADIVNIQSQEEVQYEERLLGDIVRHQIKKLFEGADLQDEFLAKYSRQPNAETKSLIKKIERRKRMQRREERNNQAHGGYRLNAVREGDRLIKIGAKRFKFELANMGREAYECILDPQGAVFYVNIDHPQYLFSRKEG